LQFDCLAVLRSFAKIVEEFRRGVEFEGLLAQIRKATSSVNKDWKEGSPPPGMDVAIADSKYKRKMNGKKGTRSPIAQGL
jgi:hypothetical protein